MENIHSFDIRFADVYGLEEAIIIGRIDSWLCKNAMSNKNFHDGTYWTTFSSVQALKYFPYMRSKSTSRSGRKIEYCINRLSELGILQVNQFDHDHSWEKKNSYTFTEAFLKSSVIDEIGVEIPVAHMVRFCSISKLGKDGDSPDLQMEQNCSIDRTILFHRLNENVPSTYYRSKKRSKTSKEEETSPFFSLLRKRISADSFRTWIEPVKFALRENDVELIVPDELFISWIQQHYEDVIRDVAQQLTRQPDVTIRYGLAG